MTKTEIAHRALHAYVDGDRSALEPLIAETFCFTSPFDNGLDRATYFNRCWPFHEITHKIEILRAIEQGDNVAVTYEMTQVSGEMSRNTEVLTIREGQITDIEVYFGWSVPHAAAPGRFINPV